MPESEEIIEEAPKEPKKVKKTSRIIKPESPEPMETVTLRSHKREAQPKDEMVIKSHSLLYKANWSQKFYSKVLQQFSTISLFRRNWEVESY